MPPADAIRHDIISDDIKPQAAMVPPADAIRRGIISNDIIPCNYVKTVKLSIGILLVFPLF